MHAFKQLPMRCLSNEKQMQRCSFYKLLPEQLSK